MNDWTFATDAGAEFSHYSDDYTVIAEQNVMALGTGNIYASYSAADRSSLQTIDSLRARLRTLEADLSDAKAILARHPEPILVIDYRHEIVCANRAAEALLGRDKLKHKLDTAFNDKKISSAAHAVFASKATQTVDFKRKGDPERHFRARFELLAHQTGCASAALLTITDMTEAKAAERMRADFVANASHELRTPLAILMGFLETLTGSGADDLEAHRLFLPVMHQQASRMARLIDDLLSLSRAELTEHALIPTRVNLPAILATVIRALELRAGERGMRIECRVAANVPMVVGEPNELAQVFQNLIDNAIKYARPDTVIAVRVEKSDRFASGVKIRVRDHGEGIPKQHLGRLTERFYRVDDAKSREVSGTGLGLAIVKHIINRHHGLLEIESKVGRGSTFSVHLNSSNQDEFHSQVAERFASSPSLKGKNDRQIAGIASKHITDTLPHIRN
jgi:two-component system phosphate regulon sensor histidine kinase PhoR